jgi:hypothetical protein
MGGAYSFRGIVRNGELAKRFRLVPSPSYRGPPCIKKNKKFKSCIPLEIMHCDYIINCHKEIQPNTSMTFKMNECMRLGIKD